jgi:hypothetical protein
MKQIRIILFFTLLTSLFISCKKDFDKEYEKPSWLTGTIYDQLQANAKLTDESLSTKLFLQAVDSAGLAAKFKVSSWTLFVPNDAAMKKYLADNGVQSLSQISNDQLYSMVLFHTIKYAYNDYQFQNPNLLSGTNPDVAARTEGQIWRFPSQFGGYIQRNVFSIPDQMSVDVVGTPKYSSLFFNQYFTNFAKTDPATSYNYFCPGINFTGFNFAASQVVSKNIVCENGYIDIIDHVAGPLLNFDEIISSDPQFSIFAHMLARLATYAINTTATNNQPNNGDPDGDGVIDNLYTKSYTSLSVKPNDENTDATNCYTAFIPTDQAMTGYLNSNIFKYYNSIDSVPLNIIRYFVQSHFSATAAWPQKISVKTDANNEFIKFSSGTDVVSAKLASNGLFYKLNKVQTPSILNSVLAPIYLNPEYTVFTRLLENSGIVNDLRDIHSSYTVFALTNKALLDSGIYIDGTDNIYPITTNASNIVKDCIFKGKLVNLTDKVFLKTLSDNVIKIVDYNVIQGGGNIENGDLVPVEAAGTTALTILNGSVYRTSKMIKRPKKNLGWYITKDPRFADFLRMCNLADMMATPNPNNTDDNTRYGFKSGFRGTVFIPLPASLTAPFVTVTTAESFTKFLMIPNVKLLNFETTGLTSYYTIAKDPVLSTQYFPVYEPINVAYDTGDLMIVLSNRVHDQVKVNTADDIIASDGIIHILPAIIQYK